MGKKGKKEIQYCFRCARRATSREHVPPLCFFPAKKEGILASNDYRSQLITVPACDIHNLTKSKDDEYLHFIIIIHFENSPIAQQYFSRKVMRSIKRRPHLVPGFLKDNVPIVINGQPSLSFYIDRERFDNSISHISRALYYHHYKKKWGYDFIVHTPDLFKLRGEDADEVNLRMQKIDRLSDGYLLEEPILGENPSIFQYKIHLDNEIPSLTVKMVFYSGFTTIAHSSSSLSPSTVESR